MTPGEWLLSFAGGIVVAAISAIATTFVALRRRSGQVRDTPAETLWAVMEEQLDELRGEVRTCHEERERERVDRLRLEAKVIDLTGEVERLKRALAVLEGKVNGG